jgi:glycosyltransferase involved in cell wall biosynthesis
MIDAKSKHVLLYEPRVEGHHPNFLRLFIEVLLAANFRLSVAADLRPASRERLDQYIGQFAGKINLLSAYDESGRRHLDGKSRSVAYCLKASGAETVFLCEFDEIASHCWRSAALGKFPPAELRGRMGGLYFRPRFVTGSPLSPGRWLKQFGFSRMIKGQWLRPLLLADEFIVRDLREKFRGAPIYFLPDPCPEGYEGDYYFARQQVNIPAGKFVFLFYGAGYRRKGLHLAVRAMLDLPLNSPAYLLCVGEHKPDAETAQGLAKLVQQHRAQVIDRHVSNEEEKTCFVASDTVLLPYINHFGSSGVLSRAMAARKPVIVSDEQLNGKMTREYKLVYLFPSGSASALAATMKQAAHMSAAEKHGFYTASANYSRIYSREAFGRVLAESLLTPN